MIPNKNLESSLAILIPRKISINISQNLRSQIHLFKIGVKHQNIIFIANVNFGVLHFSPR